MRRAGFQCPILVTVAAAPWDAETIVRHGLIASLDRLEIAVALSRAAVKQNRQATVHVKVDTGLGRFGVMPGAVAAFIAELGRLPALNVQGVYTQTAAADDGDPTTQIRRFRRVLASLEHRGALPPLRHIANSGLLLRFPEETRLSLVRVGLCVYGVFPSDRLRVAARIRSCPLHPCLRLRARVVSVRRLPAGATVGYGHAHTIARPTTVAVVAAGIVNGILFQQSAKAQVLINGRPYPLIGGVGMNHLVVDVGDDRVDVGDAATLLGSERGWEITVDDWRAWSGLAAETILFSVGTLNPRLHRLHTGYGGVATEGRYVPIVEGNGGEGDCNWRDPF